jgi:Flp pilus assembly secretin CpaC
VNRLCTLLPAKLLFTAAVFSLLPAVDALPPAPFVVEPPPNAAYPDYGAGNAAATRLRRAPARMFTFDRAALRDVLRYLADDAGIPFVGIPESNSANGRLITFTMEASPFMALESLCRDNGVRLSYENGVWYMRTVDEERERRLREEEENKLVGIAYRLKYDPVERVDFRENGIQSAGSTDSNVISTANPNLPLQNSQRVFASRAPRIINEIRTMLGLPPITFNPDGSVQGENASAGSTVASTVQTSPQAVGVQTPDRLNPTYVPPQTPQVIYNTDTNILWIVATRPQHKWVAEYLMAVDLPQDLIAIEVKFFETTKDPSKELGINWAGTMAGGYGIAARNIQASPSGNLSVATDRDRTVNTGTGVTPQDSSQATRVTNVSVAAPYSALLTADDVALSIQAFMSDDKTSLVQYPRVLTVNNREVAITTAENTPINTGVQAVQANGSATEPVGTLGYIPVGTQINILPKSIGKDQIAMTVAITVSTILRFAEVNLGLGTENNQYPVTSERIFNSSLQVPSGYTLAVGGLEAVSDNNSKNGIPFLQDLPGVGELFRSKSRQRNKKNLIIFITPTLIPNNKATRGISETPESVIPIRPNDPQPPSFTPDGRLVGGQDAVNAAFAWFDFQVRWFKQINRENRTDKETIKQLRAVIASCRMLVADIAIMRDNADPERAEKLGRHEERALEILTELNKVLSYAQDNVM